LRRNLVDDDEAGVVLALAARSVRRPPANGKARAAARSEGRDAKEAPIAQAQGRRP